MKSRYVAGSVFALMVFALMMCFAPMMAQTAKEEVDVLVAADRTEAGKRFTPPTAEKPAHCVVVSAGAKQLGDAVAGEQILKQEIVEPLVMKALAKRHYLPVDEKSPEPTLLIAYSWGSINPEGDGAGADTGADAAGGEDRSSVATDSPQTRRQMLSIVTTKNLDLHPNSPDRRLFLPSLGDGRYFILIGAYDYATLKEGKKVMLWRTRMSVYDTNIEMADSIAAMLDAGAKSFGADGYPVGTMAKVRQGEVVIGEAEVKEYITGTNGAGKDGDAGKKKAGGAKKGTKNSK